MTTPGRILIAEQDAVAASALADTLTGRGYTCAVAADHEQALNLLDRADASTDPAIGVLIVDQDFGRAGGGIELIQQLRSDRPSLVPIVVCAFRKVASAVRAMRCGAADYLLKPLIEAELHDAVERALQRHLLLIDADAPKHDSPEEEHTQTRDHTAHPTAATDGQDPREAWQPQTLAEAMQAPERDILLAALEANAWNRGETARQLDINRTTLYKKIRRYRLDEPA